MFATNRNSVSMILAAVLLAGAAFQAPAFAADTALANNERAAQAAIVGGAEGLHVASVDTSSPNLAHNEALAQRAIFDGSAPAQHRDSTINEATLTHNEIAAQRAIVDARAPDGLGRYVGAATKSVASTRSPSAR